MASNEHSSLADSQLHNPKGFSTASNNSHLTKNNSGELTWASSQRSSFFSTGGYSNSNAAAGTYFAKQFSADYHNYNIEVVEDDSDDGTVSLGMKWGAMYSEFVCPTSGTISSWKIMHSGTTGITWDLQLWKVSVTDNSNTDTNLTQLGSTVTCVNTGNTTVQIEDMSVSGTLTVAENDVIVVTVRKQTDGSNKSIWWNGTLEIVWDY